MLNSLAFFGAPEQLMIIALVVVLLFGGKKIPELMRGMGRGVGELQKGLEEGKQHIREAMHHETTQPTVEPTTVEDREKAATGPSFTTDKEKTS